MLASSPFKDIKDVADDPNCNGARRFSSRARAGITACATTRPETKGDDGTQS